MAEVDREAGFKLDITLCCHRCKRMAYTEGYEGELSEDGYLCRRCIRMDNERIVSALGTP